MSNSSSVADNLYIALMFDKPASNAATCDYGIRTEKHYLCLRQAVRSGDITQKDMHDILGDGRKITDAVRKNKYCPHPDLVFVTVYDNLGDDF